MDTFLNVAIHSEEQDYQQCIQILPLLKDFWDIFINGYGEITNILNISVWQSHHFGVD